MNPEQIEQREAMYALGTAAEEYGFASRMYLGRLVGGPGRADPTYRGIGGEYREPFEKAKATYDAAVARAERAGIAGPETAPLNIHSSENPDFTPRSKFESGQRFAEEQLLRQVPFHGRMVRTKRDAAILEQGRREAANQDPDAARADRRPAALVELAKRLQQASEPTGTTHGIPPRPGRG